MYIRKKMDFQLFLKNNFVELSTHRTVSSFPLYNCAQVFPIQKLQGIQDHLIAHLHPHSTSGYSGPCAGSALTRASAIYSASATPAASAVDAASTAATIAYLINQPRQFSQKKLSYVTSNLNIQEDGIQEKGQRCPG